MELKQTIEMMLSDDYKERFKAEYYQLNIRLKKLKNMLEKWDNGTLSFKPICSATLYEWQIECMETYLEVLKVRAEIEAIEL